MTCIDVGIIHDLTLACTASMALAELFFNMDSGYFEGIARGLKAGILRQGDYVNLCQCETLDGAPVKHSND